MIVFLTTLGLYFSTCFHFVWNFDNHNKMAIFDKFVDFCSRHSDPFLMQMSHFDNFAFFQQRTPTVMLMPDDVVTPDVADAATVANATHHIMNVVGGTTMNMRRLTESSIVLPVCVRSLNHPFADKTSLDVYTHAMLELASTLALESAARCTKIDILGTAEGRAHLFNFIYCDPDAADWMAQSRAACGLPPPAVQPVSPQMVLLFDNCDSSTVPQVMAVARGSPNKCVVVTHVPIDVSTTDTIRTVIAPRDAATVEQVIRGLADCISRNSQIPIDEVIEYMTGMIVDDADAVSALETFAAPKYYNRLMYTTRELLHDLHIERCIERSFNHTHRDASVDEIVNDVMVGIGKLQHSIVAEHMHDIANGAAQRLLAIVSGGSYNNTYEDLVAAGFVSFTSPNNVRITDPFVYIALSMLVN